MNKDKYLIGNVANLIGLSRDTLRYYEKRGILPSHKEDNGYRYYTKEDIAKLVSIIYQRKMDISLQDMEGLWAEGISWESLSTITEKRLKEEREAIRDHQKTIARLMLTQSDCHKIKQYLNQCSVQRFPDTYIIPPDVTLESSVEVWFQMLNKYPGMDMLYTFDQFTCDFSTSNNQLNYCKSQLFLMRKLMPLVEYHESPLITNELSNQDCIYTLIESETRSLTYQMIEPLLSWSASQKLTVSQQIYSTSLMQSNRNEQHSYYLEIYIPILPSSH